MIELTVKAKDIPARKVNIGPSDLIKFERQYGVGISQFSGEGMRYEWLAFLAWTALRREGVTTLEFDPFTDTLEDLTPESEGNEGSDEATASASSTSSQP